MNTAPQLTDTVQYIDRLRTRVLQHKRQTVADQSNIHLNTISRFINNANVSIQTLALIESAVQKLEAKG